MTTPISSTRRSPTGITPASQRKVSDSHTLRAISTADTPKHPHQPFASTSRHSLPRESLAPIGLPATPGGTDFARRRSIKDRTPRQVLAAQKANPKSARKSLGGHRAGKNDSPGDLLRQLSRMTDLPPGTPDTSDLLPRNSARQPRPSNTSPRPDATASQPDRRRSYLLSRPSITAQPTPPPSTHSTSLNDITASPIASTSTASPFGTTATLSLARSASNSAAPASASLRLSRVKRYPVPEAPEGFRHPHFVPGYGRQSMGSPGLGRRASGLTSMSGVGYDDPQEEEEEGGSFGVYRAGRRSEVFSEVGNVSVGASEGYFAGSRSVRTSLAVSQRSSFGVAVGGFGGEEDDFDPDGAGAGEGGELMAERSLSRISSAADEEVRAFNRFRLSDESDVESSDGGREEEEGEGDFGDEEGARALSDPAGIDWDDVLRDVGQGGGDEEDEDGTVGRQSSAESVDPNATGYGDEVEDEEQVEEEVYYGQDSDDQVTGHVGVEQVSSGRLAKAPALAKVAAARKKRALPQKVNRTTPSGASVVDLPTAKVKAAFEHATGGAFTLGPDGVDAVLNASHEFFRALMADAVRVAHQSGRKSRVDGGDLIILLYKSGVLSPTTSLSQLGRQLGLDRELQSILDKESRRFEVRVARLLVARRARKKRASEASTVTAKEGTHRPERQLKRPRKAAALPVAVEVPRSRKRSSGRGKAAGK